LNVHTAFLIRYLVVPAISVAASARSDWLLRSDWLTRHAIEEAGPAHDIECAPWAGHLRKAGTVFWAETPVEIDVFTTERALLKNPG
jgi:hypothetical protein